MFSILETILFSFKKHRIGVLGDTADRLNHQYTVIILLLLALAVCAKQYVGQPIQCWLPNEYRDTWEEYVETYCFIESTYFVPFEDSVGEQVQLSEENYKRVSYYQWVPIVLALQAALFYAPHAIWKACCDSSGIKLESLMKHAGQCSSSVDPVERNQRIRLLGTQLHHWLRRRSRDQSVSKYRRSRWLGFRLCSLYLLQKCFYVANAVGQFLTINSFLNTDYDCWFWGIRILTDLTSTPSMEWSHTGHFPRLTVCNYPVRRKSETTWESAQCVLMINMVNEKIFIFLWFWLTFVCAFTTVNLICTAWKLCRSSSAGHFVRDYMRDGVDKDQLKSFIMDYLTLDGCLLLYFIHEFGDEALICELVDSLYELFMRCHDEKYHPFVKTEEGLEVECGRCVAGIDTPKEESTSKYCRRHCEPFCDDDKVIIDEHGETVRLYCVDEE